MKTCSIFALLVCVGLAAASRPTENAEWHRFKTSFGKSYSTAEEETMRRQNWLNNLARIDEHNKRYDAGEVSYYLRENKFADLSVEEFRLQFAKNGFKQEAVNDDFEQQIYKYDGAPLPESVDWRSKGMVNAIKNQGDCGSCYAFSALAALESRYQKLGKTSKLMNFAEQQVVSCDKEDDGCNGGFPANVIQYLSKTGSMPTSHYPYHAVDSEACKYKKDDTTKPYPTGVIWNVSGDEENLQALIANEGVVSIGIMVTDNFQLYGGGVFNDDSCQSGNDTLDHGVSIVGYGKAKTGDDYYIVRNSWGAEWGNGGYIWMSRNKDNQCGISNIGMVPILPN